MEDMPELQKPASDPPRIFDLKTYEEFYIRGCLLEEESEELVIRVALPTGYH